MSEPIDEMSEKMLRRKVKAFFKYFKIPQGVLWVDFDFELTEEEIKQVNETWKALQPEE